MKLKVFKLFVLANNVNGRKDIILISYNTCRCLASWMDNVVTPAPTMHGRGVTPASTMNATSRLLQPLRYLTKFLFLIAPVGSGCLHVVFVVSICTIV